MRIHPVVTQANGIITVTLQASFNGQPTPEQDSADRLKISAFGDPKVSLVGTNGSFGPSNIYKFPTTDKQVGILTEMSSYPVRFMEVIRGNIQGPYDCVTSNPSDAAQAWVEMMVDQITAAMAELRAYILVPAIPDETV